MSPALRGAPGLQGALNALVYGFTPAVRDSLVGPCPGRREALAARFAHRRAGFRGSFGSGRRDCSLDQCLQKCICFAGSMRMRP